MLVKAKFKGKDGSRGYRTGKRYTLAFYITTGGVKIYDAAGDDSEGECLYKSLKAFLNNWDVL